MDFSHAKKGANAFTNVTTNDNYIKLQPRTYILRSAGVEFRLLVRLRRLRRATPRDHFEAIGKLQGETQPHVWYGSAIMTRTIKDRSPACDFQRHPHHFYKTLASHPDSAALQADPAGSLEEREGQRHPDRRLQGPDDQGGLRLGAARPSAVRGAPRPSPRRPASRPAKPATWSSSARRTARWRPRRPWAYNMMGHAGRDLASHRLPLPVERPHLGRRRGPDGRVLRPVRIPAYSASSSTPLAGSDDPRLPSNNYLLAVCRPPRLSRGISVSCGPPTPRPRGVGGMAEPGPCQGGIGAAQGRGLRRRGLPRDHGAACAPLRLRPRKPGAAGP